MENDIEEFRISEEKYQEKRRVFEDQVFRLMLKNVLGTSCFNCGSSDSINYHHIVPLFVGGTNRISNIVPLCKRCHNATHFGNHMSHYKKKTENDGRPVKIVTDKYPQILHAYVFGLVGKKEASRILGLGKNTINAWPPYKKFLADNGIVKHRNNIDTINSFIRRGMQFDNDHVIASVEYVDGKRFLRTYGGEEMYERTIADT